MSQAVLLKGTGGGVSSSDVTATRGDILKGYTALTVDSNDEPEVGTLESLSGQTITPTKGTQRISCKGKYMTSNIVINRIPTNYVKI